MLQLNIFLIVILINCALHSLSSSNRGFVALLYNSRYPDFKCVGAIITELWIIDSCADSSGYQYEFVKVGWMQSNIPDIYAIDKFVQPKKYRKVNFKFDHIESQSVYATIDGIFLHKTKTKILMVPNLVRTIELSVYRNVTDQAYAIYLYNDAMYTIGLKIVGKDYCNRCFQHYFDRGYEVPVQNNQYCVNTTGIDYTQCCHSQALMVWKNQLIGVMAWSTVCSRLFGVDPWVFSDVVSYRKWILSKVGWSLK